jgi:hypothetical protein
LQVRLWLTIPGRNHKYVTVKVYEAGHRQAENELKVLQHLASIKSRHRARPLVRLAVDSFELPGKNGPHVCIVHEPLAGSFSDLLDQWDGKFDPPFLKIMVFALLGGLHYLHSVAQVVHTGESDMLHSV